MERHLALLAWPILHCTGPILSIQILANRFSTSAYNGTNPKLDNTAVAEQIVYSSIINALYTDGLISPTFSLAILRDISGDVGYLTLGGLPPIDFVEDFASTPILITKIDGYPTTYDFYTINIEA